MQELMDFDRRWGTDTDGEIPVELLEHTEEVARGAVSYEATDPAAFRHMIAELPVAPPGYTFLDLGSGKGRVVMLAARRGFRRVVGVEASVLLHRTACENLRAWARAGHDTRRVELRNEDAATTPIPDDPCVIYLFNPFRERTAAKVLRNLQSSLRQHRRDLWLIYYNPQLGHMLRGSCELARVRVGRGFQQGDYAIWRSRRG